MLTNEQELIFMGAVRIHEKLLDRILPKGPLYPDTYSLTEKTDYLAIDSVYSANRILKEVLKITADD